MEESFCFKVGAVKSPWMQTGVIGQEEKSEAQERQHHGGSSQSLSSEGPPGPGHRESKRSGLATLVAGSSRQPRLGSEQGYPEGSGDSKPPGRGGQGRAGRGLAPSAVPSPGKTSVTAQEALNHRKEPSA